MCQIKANSWKIHYGYGKCLKCGDTNLNTLTWHHRDKTTKEFNISKKACKWWALSNMPYKQWQTNVWNKIRNEVRKCDLLCKWCHIQLHRTEDLATRDKKTHRNKQTDLFWKSLNKRSTTA